MRKVCEVYLVSSSATDERGVELTFPVSQYEMMDAFEQIHTKSPGDVYWQVDEFYCFDYVWGTFGLVLTESLFEAKLAQYPDALAGNADFIRQTWVGGRTTDCVGLIKGYGWLNAETEEIVYNTNGMPDISANEMYHSATVSGTIDTIPETPGLAVWHEGHIGVYIGNGEVVEAMGTRYGVVKTKLEGARWTHWLKIPYISYD